MGDGFRFRFIPYPGQRPTILRQQRPDYVSQWSDLKRNMKKSMNNARPNQPAKGIDQWLLIIEDQHGLLYFDS